MKHFSLNFKKHFALSWKLSNLSNVLLLILQTKIGNFKLPFQEQNFLKVTFYAVKMKHKCVNKPFSKERWLLNCVNKTARRSAVWEFFQKMRQQNSSPALGLVWQSSVPVSSRKLTSTFVIFTSEIYKCIQVFLQVFYLSNSNFTSNF